MSALPEPLLWMALTVGVYVLMDALYQRRAQAPLLNPVLTTCGALIVVLLLARVPYPRYFEGTQFLHFMLGPATVALALPLYQQWERLKRVWRALLLALVAGLATATASVLLMLHALGVSRETLLSLAPKSVTTPIAMSLSEQIGGIPALAAMAVLVTGTCGAVLAVPLFRRLHITDDAVKGLALGVAAHGVGTARAFQLSAEAGAFAGLGMALAGLVMALVLPWLL